MTEIVCEIDKLSTEQLKKALADSIALFQFATLVKELEDGYAICFKEQPNLISSLSQILELNKICCPMLKQAIVIEADGRPTWLELSGRNGVKEFIAIDLLKVLPEDLAIQSGLEKQI